MVRGRRGGFLWSCYSLFGLEQLTSWTFSGMKEGHWGGVLFAPWSNVVSLGGYGRFKRDVVHSRLVSVLVLF